MRLDGPPELPYAKARMPSLLKTIKLPVSANLKITLVFLAFAIVTGTLFYTNQLVNDLKTSERKTVQIFVNLFTLAANAVQQPAEPGNYSPPDVASDIAFQFGLAIDFPIIITNRDKKIESSVDRATGKESFAMAFIRNVDFDQSAPFEEQKQQLGEHVERMGQVYEPLPIYTVIGRDSLISNYVFYDESGLIKRIRMLPLVEIIIVAMFIFVGYIGFSHVKRNEQSNIWVGMAKETAHQLGTPLSSLLGWIELLRYMPEDTTQVLEAADEMERDVERLNKIAHRFSKIGSAAQVKIVELNGVLRNVVLYFERRLPHLGKKVALTLQETPTPVYVAINTDLFEWVFENLVRNAADAIDHPDGRITLQVHELRGVAIVDVVDNGRGIDPKIKKDIFRPGFSTKQRGWGLGLSLAKRIVEEYHGGRIMVKSSSSAGTTFRIRLAAADPADEPETVRHRRKTLRGRLRNMRS